MMIKPNRTSSYISTIFMDNKKDLEHLQSIRNMVKNLNRDLRRQKARDNYNSPLQFYVKLQGRLGKNRKGRIADMYRSLWNSRSNVSISVNDAKYCDVYLYRRWQ